MAATGHRADDATAYAQGFLPLPKVAEFEAHLAGCADCQASVANARNDEMTSTGMLIKSGSLHPGVAAAAAPSFMARHGWKLGAALAVLVAGVAAFFFLGH